MLSIRGLTKSYADVRALDDVSFSVEKGEVVALLGANGSGKTTTVQSICHLIDWDQGDIQIDQQSTRKNPSYLRQIGAVLGGCRNTNWRLTAKQNADYFARLRGFSGTTVSTTINRLHQQLGLDQHAGKEVMKLSTGNKQKAALLAAMSYSPDYVLLDEPTLGLDFTTVEELQRIIESQAAEHNQGFLITSHDLDFIDRICHKVVVLEQGKLLFEGSIAQLKARLYHYELTMPFNLPLNMAAIESLWQGRFDVRDIDGELTIQFDQAEQCLPFMAYLHDNNVQPEALHIHPLSIEKAYQTLIQEQRA